MSEVGQRRRPRPLNTEPVLVDAATKEGSPRLHGGHTTITHANGKHSHDRLRARRSPLSIICASPALSFIFLASILSNASISVVVPSLALQLESMSASPELLGYVAAAAPLVSVISPTLSGWLADTWAAAGAKTPYSRVYLATLTLATLGNALQSVSKSVFSLGASRVLIGLSTGSVSVGLGYIMRELPHLDERTAVVNIFSGVEMMGYIIGTALGGVLSTADGSFLGLTVNGFNAPTLVSTAAALLLLLFGLPGFAARERKLRSSTPTKSELASKQASKQKTAAAAAAASTGEPSSSGGSKHRAGVSGMGPDKQQQHSGDDSGDDDVEPPPPPPFPHPKSSAEIRPSSTSLSSLDQPVRHHHHRDRHRHHDRHRRPKPFTLGLIIAMYCLVAAMYNALETTASPLTNRFFQWGVKENAMLWTGSGVLGTAVSLGLGHLPPELLRPSDLLAAALGMAVAGPLLMAASLTRELAATDTLGPPTGLLGPATKMAAKAAVVVAEAAQASLGAGKGGEGGEGQEEEGVRQRRWSVAMFLAGFVLFDIGYVVVESMLTILFAAAIEQRQSEPDVDENDDDDVDENNDDDDDDDDDGSENKQTIPHHEMERDDGEGHEAFYFGVFTSAGWFLGCALGAVAGNHLFLVSAHALLTGCSGTAAGVALLLFACRRHVLMDTDGGRLFAHLEKVLDKGFAIRPRCGGIGSGRLAAPASCSPAFSPSLSCTSNNEGRGGAASSMASLELNRDTCGSDKDPPCQNAS